MLPVFVVPNFNIFEYNYRSLLLIYKLILVHAVFPLRETIPEYELALLEQNFPVDTGHRTRVFSSEAESPQIKSCHSSAYTPLNKCTQPSIK